MEWPGLIALTVSVGALAVSLYNRRRSTLKEKVDVTRTLYGRLLRAEASAKDLEIPQMLFGRNNVTFWRKKREVWDRVGTVWEVFEELSLLDQRGFIDRPLARAYFGSRFRKYDEKWFAVAETFDAGDSLMLDRIRSLSSWLPLSDQDAESAQEAYNMLRRQDRTRESFDSALREGLVRLFPPATRVDKTEVGFHEEYRVFGNDDNIARVRLRSSHLRGEDISRNKDNIALLLNLIERKGVPHWQEHPGALGVIVDRWTVDRETQRSTTYVDLVFQQAEEQMEVEGSAAPQGEEDSHI